MLKIILIALPLVIAVLGTIVALQSSEFRVVRSAILSAPAQALFALVNDFHRWEAWSPWEKLDPALERSYDGSPAGVGAVYSWVGNNQVGEGRMTILESNPNDLVRIKLEFLKPFAATHTAEFTFKPEGDRTRVTWNMFGEKNFLSKAIGLFMNMDKMIGDNFEQGLAQLESAAKESPR
jgi:ribosome-associated toxin RatA of RatAB toxin-antitoxin module